MMSTQLYTPTAMAAPQAHPFTNAILEQQDLVPGLLQVRLQGFYSGPSKTGLPYMPCKSFVSLPKLRTVHMDPTWESPASLSKGACCMYDVTCESVVSSFRAACCTYDVMWEGIASLSDSVCCTYGSNMKEPCVYI